MKKKIPIPKGIWFFLGFLRELDEALLLLLEEAEVTVELISDIFHTPLVIFLLISLCFDYSIRQ